MKIKKEKEERKRKRQRTIIFIVSVAAMVSIAFGIFGLWQMKIAEKALTEAEIQKEFALQKEKQIKKNATSYYLRDANSYLQQKEYKIAMEKYIYLRDTLMQGETTTAIEEKITECKQLIDKNQAFYDLMDKAKLFSNKQEYKNALLQYEEALKINMNNESVISKLKDLLLIIDTKANEYSSEADVIQPINPTEATRIRKKARDMKTLSNKIKKIIKEYK